MSCFSTSGCRGGSVLLSARIDRKRLPFGAVCRPDLQGIRRQDAWSAETIVHQRLSCSSIARHKSYSSPSSRDLWSMRFSPILSNVNRVFQASIVEGSELCLISQTACCDQKFPPSTKVVIQESPCHSMFGRWRTSSELTGVEWSEG